MKTWTLIAALVLGAGLAACGDDPNAGDDDDDTVVRPDARPIAQGGQIVAHLALRGGVKVRHVAAKEVEDLDCIDHGLAIKDASEDCPPARLVLWQKHVSPAGSRRRA